MVVRDRIGRSGSRAESWETIIARADEAARKSGMQRVLFGGWGIDPRARAATDAAFRGVWERQRRVLERQTREIADERVRVGGFLAFAALVQWVARRRSVHPLRLVALATVAGTIAVTIAAAAQWLGATFSVSPAAIFSVECAAALVAGAAIEQVVQFDPRKTVTEGVEKSA
jgi:hypothetical protein